MRFPFTLAATFLGTVGLALAGTPAAAAHNNPWAGPDDAVEAQFHDDNQAESAGTPGRDEMHGMEAGATAGRDAVPGPGGRGGGATRD